MRRRHRRSTDEAYEAVISGRSTSEEFDDLATLVSAVRLAATPVAPDDELRSMFDEGIEVEPAPAATAPAVVGAAGTARPLRTRGRQMWDGLTTRLAGLGLTAKIALGSAVAVAGVTTAATLVPEHVELPDDPSVVVEPASEDELDPPADEHADEGLETAGEAIASVGEDGWGQWVTQENGEPPESLPASEDADEGIATADEESDGRSTAGLETAEEAIADPPPTPPAGTDTGEEASGARQQIGGDQAGTETDDPGSQAEQGGDNAQRAGDEGARGGP